MNLSKDFSALRDQYPSFFYDGFHIEQNENGLKITYDFRIADLAEFHPVWTFPVATTFKNTDLQTIRACAFHLGLVELVSYWKITCSPNVYINAGAVTEDQIRWWKKLYFYGLGEFFYINNISTDIESFMAIHIRSDIDQSIKQRPENTQLSGNLIPVGGGKDSIVTLDLLRRFKETNSCFIVNKTSARIESAKTAGYADGQIAIAQRTLDPNMIALNKQGFLNGHTPLSAIIAFSGVMAAYLLQREYVILSNEASANDPTVFDAEVNHQYSKSFQFELDFNAYLENYMNMGIKYFSLLRPFCELQIAEYFSRLTPFLTVFNSCNLGTKIDDWCRNCSKCLFIYILLSPFFSQNQLQAIFGANFANQAKFLDDFEKLTGIQKNKPFECVGSRDEVNAALILAIRRIRENGEEMPRLYRQYLGTSQFAAYSTQPFEYQEHFDHNHLIPAQYLAALNDSKLGK